MIEYRKTTVFNSKCDAIVNTVNCVGVMGAGIALEFSLRYPNMFKMYEEDCKNNSIQIGKINLYEEDGQIILNFPTKVHWKYPSKLEWIEKGLDYLVNNYKTWNVKSIAIPPLGCNNGGLDFEKEVKPLIEQKLKVVEIVVVVCLDPGYPEGKEKQMLELFNKADLEKICSECKINGKAKEGLIKNQNLVKRFFEINLIPGLGKVSYEKLFKYFYNFKESESTTYFEQLKFDI